MDKTAVNIADAITKSWNKGIEVNDKTLFFLESSFGISTGADLKENLNDPESPDCEMILEILLFPDQQIRCEIEPLIEPEGVSDANIQTICNLLAKMNKTVRVYCPSWSDNVAIPLSKDQIEQFVARLFLAHTLDPDLDRTIKKFRSLKETVQCRVSLRKRKFKLTASNIQILSTLIQNAEKTKLRFRDLFELAIEIISENSESTDLHALFIEKRKQTKKMLVHIREFEEKKDRYSMEYLMMQRYPVPVDSFENTFKRLQYLDVLIEDILSIPSPVETLPAHVRDLGGFDPKTDMQNIINILS